MAALAVFSWTLCPSWSWEHSGSCFHEQQTSVLWDEPVVTEPCVVCLPCVPLAPLACRVMEVTLQETL